MNKGKYDRKLPSLMCSITLAKKKEEKKKRSTAHHQTVSSLDLFQVLFLRK